MSSSSYPDLNPPSLGDIAPPDHLAQRLAHDSERFGKNVSPDALNQDLAAHDQRHESFLANKASKGHHEVEHAKQIAATHVSDPNNVALKEGENRVEEKLPPFYSRPCLQGYGRTLTPVVRSTLGVTGTPGHFNRRKSLERQQQELDELSARLKKADEVERQLRARLGEAVGV
ncbi:hypothetical protein JCM11641_004150 [Rhodosporidiobolus odoratus]